MVITHGSEPTTIVHNGQVSCCVCCAIVAVSSNLRSQGTSMLCARFVQLAARLHLFVSQ